MRGRTRALIKAIILLPGNTVVVIPFLLLYFEGGIDLGWGMGMVPALAGGLFIGFGVLMAVHTVRLFFVHGEGTPAPWEPPRKLVVRGAYRHVRNPMITGVLFMLVGEALVFGSRYISIWAAVFFALNHLYFLLWEEPALEQRFGAEYIEYKRRVPRWIPRLRPYEKPPGQAL